MIYKMAKTIDLAPTGKCWCGCGEEVPEESYFSRGHDKRAESWLLQLLYGPKNTVAAFLAEHGYGGARGKNLKSTHAIAERNATAAWTKGK